MYLKKITKVFIQHASEWMLTQVHNKLSQVHQQTYIIISYVKMGH